MLTGLTGMHLERPCHLRGHRFGLAKEVWSRPVRTLHLIRGRESRQSLRALIGPARFSAEEERRNRTRDYADHAAYTGPHLREVTVGRTPEHHADESDESNRDGCGRPIGSVHLYLPQNWTADGGGSQRTEMHSAVAGPWRPNSTIFVK